MYVMIPEGSRPFDALIFSRYAGKYNLALNVLFKIVQIRQYTTISGPCMFCRIADCLSNLRGLGRIYAQIGSVPYCQWPWTRRVLDQGQYRISCES